MEVNGIPIVDAPVGEARSTASLAENFDNFLTLLTTQLQNQDPLSPLDTTEFTNQLTNFAQVEQIINSNNKLERLIDLQGPAQLSTGVSYIGKVVEAPGDAAILQDGQARIGYQLKTASTRTTISILDSRNNLVGVFEGSTLAGDHVFEWDGKNSSGAEVPDGTYRILVTPIDAEGNTLESSITTFGRVTGVEIDDGTVTLNLGSLSVDLSDVLSVHEAKSAENG